MSQLIQRLAADLQTQRLLAPRQKILVAVSGGLDSMVLLHALKVLATRRLWKLSVAHFNHQLRGRASAADERLVSTTAASLGLPFHADRSDVKGFAKQTKISLEMAARKLRHEFLARVARKQKIFTVALAHHADDQVELFFLRCLRGAGGEGLSGMKWSSPSPVDKQLNLVRPLLGFTRGELLAFANDQGIRFREDASNASTDFLRNRIRHELLPLLAKQYQPGVHHTVRRLMEIVGAESEFVSAAARQWLMDSRTPFDHLALAVQRQVLNHQLRDRDVTVDFELVEQLRSNPGKFINVRKNLSVACEAGKLNWTTPPSGVFGPAAIRLSLQESSCQFAGRKFCWHKKKLRRGQGGRPFKRQANLSDFFESFDADKVGDEIILRHWRAGDRFQPIGMPRSVKLQDLFVNAKISAARRHELILAATRHDEIFWVEGLRIGENFKLTKHSKAKLDWECSVLPV